MNNNFSSFFFFIILSLPLLLCFVLRMPDVESENVLERLEESYIGSFSYTNIFWKRKSVENNNMNSTKQDTTQKNIHSDVTWWCVLAAAASTILNKVVRQHIFRSCSSAIIMYLFCYCFFRSLYASSFFAFEKSVARRVFK